MNRFSKLLTSLLLIFICSGAFAQTFDLKSPIPLDPAVRYGKLPNGMTYYIRYNALPEKRGEFHIVHNAGAILEEDNQDGLAHFLEHMAFNGIAHFPGNTMMNYLEANGMKFGANVNAGTGTDNTAYMLTDVPLRREGLIDTCLLILHDWSGSILCSQEEIDAERGVITEEWRTRRNAATRAQFAFMPVMYKGSQYAKRTIIGSLDVIQHFKRQELLDFYHKWYRPDLQAVIIVGDFDVDMMEAKVKKIMGDIPTPVNPAPRPTYTIPDNKEPLVAIYTDPEITSTSFAMYIKRDATKPENKNWEYYRSNLVMNLTNGMISSRTRELMQQENLPLTGLSIGYSGFRDGKRSFYCGFTAKPGKVNEAARMALAEVERVDRYGFLPSELERAKTNLKRNVETMYAERNKQRSNNYISEYTNNFLENEPAPSVEEIYKFVNEMLGGITVDEVNNTVKAAITDENRIVTLSAPESEKVNLPTEEGLLALVAQSETAELKPYVDVENNQPLLAKEPKAGTVKKEKVLSQFGATEWTLSNGAKVVFKTTDFKADEITISGTSKGGYSLLPDSELASAKVFSAVVNGMGLGNFGPIELSKALTGKKASVSVSLRDNAENLFGSASPQDLETMLQLVYLKFTQPRFDQTVLNTFIERQKVALEQAKESPDAAFRDSISIVRVNNHPRMQPFSLNDLAKVDFKQLEKIYKDRFCDPANFTFVFVGNIDVKTFKPLVEKYIASLPSVKRNETWKDLGVRPPKGKVDKEFKRELKTPKVSVFVEFTGPLDNTQRNRIAAPVLGDILRMRYTKSIREEKGGAYSVSAGGYFSEEPVPGYSISVSFDTNEKQAREMVDIVSIELKKIAEEGPLADDLQKVKEFRLKSYDQNLKENGYWSGTISSYYWSGKDESATYRKTLENLSTADIQALAKKIVEQGNTAEVLMWPAN